MIANFFGKSKPINVLVISVIFLCIYIFAVISGKIALNFFVLVAFLVTLSIIYFILVKNNLTFDNLYAFLFFVILTAFFIQVFIPDTSVYANLTLLLFLRRAYSLQSLKAIFKKIFKAGLWLGVSFIIEPFSVIFILLLYTSIYLHTKLTIRTLVIPIIGFCTSLFLYFTYCFWIDETANFNQLFYWFTDYDFSIYKNTNYLFSILFVSVFVLASIFLKTPKILPIKNTFRKSWLLVLVHLVLSIFLIVFTKNKNGSEFLYALFPCAIIMANGLELYQKKRASNVVLLLFFVCAILVNFL